MSEAAPDPEPEKNQRPSTDIFMDLVVVLPIPDFMGYYHN